MTTRNDEPEILSRSNDLFFNYFHDGHRHIVCLPKTCLTEQLSSGPTPSECEQVFRLHWKSLRRVVDTKLQKGEAGLIYLDAADLHAVSYETVRIEP